MSIYVKTNWSLWFPTPEGSTVITCNVRAPSRMKSPAEMLSPEDYKFLESTEGTVFVVDQRLAGILADAFPNISVVYNEFSAEFCKNAKQAVVEDIASAFAKRAKLPSRIAPNIYLGDAGDASSEKVIRELNITVIINCTVDIPFGEFEGVEFHRIPVDDKNEANIQLYFEEAIGIIETASSQGKTVLVHCMAGISRSATIVAAYLMKTRGMTHVEAITEIKKTREKVDPNIGFVIRLMEFEKSQVKPNVIDEQHDVAADEFSSPTSQTPNDDLM